MKTDELINQLSEQPRSKSMRPAIIIIAAVILSCAIALVASWALFGVRTDFIRIVQSGDHGFFIKLVFAVSIMASAFFMVVDLSVPGRKQRMPAFVVTVPFAFMAVTAIHELRSISIDNWPSHASHESWLTCFWQIMLLAVPAFALLTTAVRKLAPTDLRRAGFFIGLFSGGAGVLAYICHAEGESVPFSTWMYSAAVLAVALGGTVVGPKLLYWR